MANSLIRLTEDHIFEWRGRLHEIAAHASKGGIVRFFLNARHKYVVTVAEFGKPEAVVFDGSDSVAAVDFYNEATQ